MRVPFLRCRSATTGRFFHWSLSLLLLILIGATPLAVNADLFYKVQKIVQLSDLDPDAPQDTPMVVTGLNDAGCLAGFFTDSTYKVSGRSDAILHAFVWDDAAHILTDLNDSLGSSSMALCVNDASMVAGVFWTAGDIAEQDGFVWQNGNVTTFQSPEGTSINSVSAINSAGLAVGTYYSATDSNLRAFIWDGSACTDLGDLGNSDTAYVWPQAINDSGQVVGTVYDMSRLGAVYPTGFIYDYASQHIDYLDPDQDFNYTMGLAINAAGQIAGEFFAPGLIEGQLGQPGGFYDLSGALTDVGNLGLTGTIPFAIMNNGTIYGTSYTAGQTLHFFSWNPAGTITDLGAAYVQPNDAGYQLTGANAAGSLSGFVTDAGGGLQAAVSVGRVQYRVNQLLPRYEALANVSSANGSQMLINSPGQLACAGTDANGHQIAVLLSVDPDTDNDGLPDSWEMQFYGHLGVNKNARETGGGGLTNREAYERGVDPVDFYVGQTPVLAMVSGNLQIAAPGSFLPAPLVVQLTDGHGNPLVGAPVTFYVVGNAGNLQAAREASPKNLAARAHRCERPGAGVLSSWRHGRSDGHRQSHPDQNEAAGARGVPGDCGDQWPGQSHPARPRRSQ